MSSKKDPKNFKISKLSNSDGILQKVTHYIPTGCLPLDVALCGGWPVGRISELYGGEASGKSAMGAIYIASAQKLNYPSFYADSETVVDEDFFYDLGVDVEKLNYEQPEKLEEVFSGDETRGTFGINGFINWKNAMYGEQQPCAIVWDSIASTTTQAEMDRGDEEKSFSDFAIHLSRILRRDRYFWSKSNASLLFINQIRTKMGITFGDSDSTYGGKSVAFYSTARVKLSTVKKLTEQREKMKVTVGEVVKAQVKKLKVGPAFRYCEFPFHFQHGIDDVAATIMALKAFGLADQSGQTIKLKIYDEDASVKKDDFQEFLENEDNRLDIYDALDEAFAV